MHSVLKPFLQYRSLRFQLLRTCDDSKTSVAVARSHKQEHKPQEFEFILGDHLPAERYDTGFSQLLPAQTYLAFSGARASLV